NLGVVIGGDQPIEVGIAVVGVLDEDGVGIDALSVELGENGRAVAAVVDDAGQRSDTRIGRAGGGAADACAVPCAMVAAGLEDGGAGGVDGEIARAQRAEAGIELGCPTLNVEGVVASSGVERKLSEAGGEQA